MRVIWRIGVVALATAAALVPIDAAFVERWYSTRLFPVLQHLLTAASNRVAYALLDAAIIVTLTVWVVRAIRDIRRGPWPAARSILVRTVVWAAVGYLAFLALWGLNYRRVAMTTRLQSDTARVTRDNAARLARTSVEQLNALYQPAHAMGWRVLPPVDPDLAAGFATAATDLGLPPIVAARPKRSLLNPYFRRAGVDGMTDPFFLETLVIGDLLPFERPFVIAHEWGHLAGIGDEGEANFVGWLACVHGQSPAQYSGWLFLYAELVPVVAASDRASLAGALQAGPRADLRAIRDRIARDVSPRISSAGWRVYDSYLKANRVEAGAASYGTVVRLLLATEFRGDWHPVRRAE
jgi:hypothetical protein